MNSNNANYLKSKQNKIRIVFAKGVCHQQEIHWQLTAVYRQQSLKAQCSLCLSFGLINLSESGFFSTIIAFRSRTGLGFIDL